MISCLSVGLEMCLNNIWCDVKAIYNHTTSSQKEILKVLEEMLPVLITGNIIIADMKVHELERG